MVPSALMGPYKATSRSAVRARCILSVSSANRKLGVGGEAAGQLPNAPSPPRTLDCPCGFVEKHKRKGRSYFPQPRISGVCMRVAVQRFRLYGQVAGNR
jgi:hypothetical protein